MTRSLRLLYTFNLDLLKSVLASLVLLLSAFTVCANDQHVTKLIAATPASSLAYGKLYSRDILRGVTLKNVYVYNALWTTALGPAYANIVEQSSNFLKCSPPRVEASAMPSATTPALPNRREAIQTTPHFHAHSRKMDWLLTAPAMRLATRVSELRPRI
jgi:hypothetical protein